MTRKEFEERTAFEAILQDECERNVTDGIVAATPQAEHRRRCEALIAARLLCRHGRTYARIQEVICNGVEWCQWDTNESFNKRQARHEQWTEKWESQLEKRIRAIVADMGPGFGVVFQGDPRGCTVKVTVPSGRTNDWGREGICVPTA